MSSAVYLMSDHCMSVAPISAQVPEPKTLSLLYFAVMETFGQRRDLLCTFDPLVKRTRRDITRSHGRVYMVGVRCLAP